MPFHVVVDGSNIATEGRSFPSLAQLNDAVVSFMAEHPDALVTVVVDATFGHRIDAKEVKEFDEAVANNELVAPPAGAVGRGDAFVLSIANKVGATILTNDSYQEFHPDYPWLFDEGRIIGGKPVPHIGWVFVTRVPVRGPVSRSAMKQAKRKKSGASDSGTVRTGSPEASKPMPVPKAPPPGARLKGGSAAPAAPSKTAPSKAAPSKAAPSKAEPAAAAAAAVPAKGHPVNDVMPFLHFVEHHPVGSIVNAVVESYSSHGAYVRVGDVKGYVPLRLMADPAPRSAREFMKIGEAVTLVVDSFAAARRSVDLATPAMAPAAATAAPAAKRSRASKAAAPAGPIAERAAEPAAGPAKRTRAKAAAAPAGVVAADDAPTAAPAKKAVSKRASAQPVRTAPAAPAARTKKAAAASEPAPTPPAKRTRAAKAAPAPPAEPAPTRAPRSRANKAASPALEVTPAAPKAPARRRKAAD